MKAFKIIGGLLALVLVVVIGVGVYLFSNINQIVKEVVETVGPDVTKTDVRLAEVDIKLTEGSGELRGFVIGNPEGFSAGHFLKSEKVRLKIDPSSVTSDIIVIDDIVVEGVNIAVEEKQLKTNIQKLLKNLESEGTTEKEEVTTEDGKEVRLVVEKLRFANNSVDFKTEKYGSVSIDIPALELSSLGERDTGLTPDELGKAILKPLLKQVKKSAEKRLKELLAADFKEAIDKKKEELKQKAKDKEDELKASAEEKLKEKLGDDSDEKVEKLKSLFK